jgi:hypothetical protein
MRIETLPKAGRRENEGCSGSTTHVKGIALIDVHISRCSLQDLRAMRHKHLQQVGSHQDRNAACS